MPEPPRRHVPQSSRKKKSRRPAPQRSTMPVSREAEVLPPGMPSTLPSSPAPLSVPYEYVLKDIKRIGIIVVPMIILIIALSFFL